jgi:hypothetical protein
VAPRSHLRLIGLMFRQAWEDLPASLRISVSSQCPWRKS